MAYICGVDDLALDMAGFSFGLFTAQPAKMRGVVAHISRCEGFTDQVCGLVMDLVVTLRDKAAPLAVKGVSYGEIGVAAIAVFGEVWGI